MLILSTCLALAAPPTFGVGLLAQGIRPGAVVETQLPLAVSARGERTTTHAIVPTVSGWVHPGHYVPLQLHAHYAFMEDKRRFVSEVAIGPGATWALNARRTVRVTPDGLERVPLAGKVVFSPGIGIGLGRSGPRTLTLVRLRLNAWLGWQQSVAVSSNLELVVRFLRGSR